MGVSPKHAVVALAVTLLLSNARCFAACSPGTIAVDVSSESGKSSDCHRGRSEPAESQHSNRESPDTHNHSCVHDLLITAVTDNHTIPLAFPLITFSASVVPHAFATAGPVAGTDVSPPIRSHPGLTIVIRV
jgi:hypothetical protein